MLCATPTRSAQANTTRTGRSYPSSESVTMALCCRSPSADETQSSEYRWGQVNYLNFSVNQAVSFVLPARFWQSTAVVCVTTSIKLTCPFLAAFLPIGAMLLLPGELRGQPGPVPRQASGGRSWLRVDTLVRGAAVNTL